MKIGAVTIGQSPRVDVTPDILPLFGNEIELVQAGALDGLTKTEIEQMKPDENDYVLVSRLNDGTFAKFGESFILARMQQCIEMLEASGVTLIMILCGGSFPNVFHANVPLIYPAKLLNSLANALSPNSNIIVITPDQDQIQQAYDQWNPIIKTVTPIPANPYGDISEIYEAAYKAKEIKADLVVMDCIGYTQESRKIVSTVTQKPVLLCRTTMARVVAEILGL